MNKSIKKVINKLLPPILWPEPIYVLITGVMTEDDEAMEMVGGTIFPSQELPSQCLIMVVVYGVGTEVTGT